MPGPATHETHLPCDRSAPRLARRWLSQQLNPLGLDRELHDGAVLLVSELVSDVVLRARHAPVVTMRVDADEIVVGVEDAWADAPPLDEHGAGTDGELCRGEAGSTAPDLADPGARDPLSRTIVDHVADRWGSCDAPDGTRVVWFALRAAA
jgi:anti-sigma regulatory factor (Ser/Thr protein kinase)